MDFRTQQLMEQRALLYDSRTVYPGPAALAMLCSAAGTIADKDPVIQIDFDEEEARDPCDVSQSSA